MDEPCRIGPVEVTAIGSDRRLLHARLTGVRRVLSAAITDAALRCRALQPLDAHLGERCRERQGVAGDAQGPLAEALRTLAGQGFFVTRGELLAAARQHPQDRIAETAGGRIQTVAIPTTGDRPELWRCVESHAEHLAAFGRGARLLISDDAPDPGKSRLQDMPLVALSRRLGVRCQVITRAGRARLAARLCETAGIPPSIAAFGLLGELPQPSAGASLGGANRNAILLATLGQRIFSVDDDTVCRLGAQADVATVGWALDSGLDPRRYQFFPDRAAAVAATRPVSEDVLGWHEMLLGRSLSGLVDGPLAGGALACGAADGGLIEDLCRARGKVAITTMGVRGHSGVKWPTRLLEMEPPWAAQLLPSAELYRASAGSAEIVASVATTTVSNRSFFASMFCGLDNTLPLPPFMPVGRSQDVLFWRTALWALGDGYVGHLPRTLVHDPASDRSRSVDLMWRHTGIELAFLLSDFVGRADGRTPAEQSPAGRLDRLGAQLVDLSSRPLPEFSRLLGDVCRQRHVARMGRLVSRLGEVRGAPAFWTSDVERHLVELERLVVAPELPPPFDVGAEGQEGWRRTRDLTGLYGSLLRTWPALVDGVRRLQAGGEEFF